MKREEFEDFFKEGKGVKVKILQSGYIYRGLIKKLNPTYLILNDIKLGDIVIAYEDICSPFLPHN